MSRCKDLMVEAVETALLQLSAKSGYEYDYLASMWWDVYLPGAIEDGEDWMDGWHQFVDVAMERDL